MAIFLMFVGNCFADEWPNRAPVNAINCTISSEYYPNFTLNVWRSDGHIWVQYKLIENTAKIFSHEYKFVLNNIQYSESPIFINKLGDRYSYSTLYADCIFKMCKYDGERNEYVDYFEARHNENNFTMIYEEGDSAPYYLDIPRQSDFNEDSDNDGLPDAWELQYFDNLSVTDGTGDYDNDGLNDLSEYSIGTNPTNNDTDGDGFKDGAEIGDPLDIEVYPLGGHPGTATLLSPSDTSTNPITYTWEAVHGATWYRLWVNDQTGNRIQTWYTAEQCDCAAGEDTCFIESSTSLSSGECTWWIRTWNEKGYGEWSDGMDFRVE
jgi:hypothetical protein